jgi:hypothetical protein
VSINQVVEDQEIVVYAVRMLRWDGRLSVVTGDCPEYKKAVRKALDRLANDSEYYRGAKVYEERYRSRRSFKPYAVRLVLEMGE